MRRISYGVAVAVGVAGSAFGADEGRRPELWFSPGYAEVRSDGRLYRGAQFAGGLRLAADEAAPASFGFSLQHPFNAEPVERFDLLGHADLALFRGFGAGLVVGIEYLESNAASGGCLKPVIGVEAGYRFARWDDDALSAIVSWRSAKGETGSLLLNGGSSALSATVLSLGLAYSFGVSVR